MFLSIENIGKIKESSIEIAGITVIAGENNTGKSTLGEVLFCIFNSFHDPESRVRKERIGSIGRAIRNLRSSDLRRSFFPYDIQRIAELLVDEMSDEQKSESDIKAALADIINGFLQQHERGRADFDFDGDDFNRVVHRIDSILSIPDELLFRTVLTSALNDEFRGQVNNLFTNSAAYAELRIKDSTSKITIIDNSVESISDVLRLETEAVYLDDPFVLDSANRPFRMTSVGHREHLQELLRSSEADRSQGALDEIIISTKLAEIYKNIDMVCAGEIVSGKRSGLGYMMQGAEEPLNVENLSSGMKAFAILKLLLKKGIIEENGTIILDEPEVHLHPEWQIRFAELVVLLQKEFGLHVLMNTHSPYFLSAIQVYADRYGVLEDCRFYQAVSDGRFAHTEDVTDSLEPVYAKLVEPFQTLENQVYSNGF